MDVRDWLLLGRTHSKPVRRAYTETQIQKSLSVSFMLDPNTRTMQPIDSWLTE